MLYALIGSGLVGALSTALLLWRKSVLETKLAKSLAIGEASQKLANELLENVKLLKDQLDRKDNQIKVLEKQRDQAIEELAKHGAHGSLLSLLRKQALNPD